MLDVALTGLLAIVSFGRMGSARSSTAGGPAAGVELSEDSGTGDEVASGLSV